MFSVSKGRTIIRQEREFLCLASPLVPLTAAGGQRERHRDGRSKAAVSGTSGLAKHKNSLSCRMALRPLHGRKTSRPASDGSCRDLQTGYRIRALNSD